MLPAGAEALLSKRKLVLERVSHSAAESGELHGSSSEATRATAVKDGRHDSALAVPIGGLQAYIGKNYYE
jgi:hypothetical protein